MFLVKNPLTLYVNLKLTSTITRVSKFSSDWYMAYKALQILYLYLALNSFTYSLFSYTENYFQAVIILCCPEFQTHIKQKLSKSRLHIQVRVLICIASKPLGSWGVCGGVCMYLHTYTHAYTHVTMQEVYKQRFI